MVRFEESSITFPYKRSLGPVIGAFMTALAEKRILGIRNGDGVLVPPMEWDPATGAELPRELVEVGPAGTIQSWTWVPDPTEQHPLDRPFAFAFIRLDGASTPLLYAVDAGSPGAMTEGMRVAPRWKGKRIGHITDIACFVPGEESEVEGEDLGPAAEPVEMMDYLASITYRNPVPPTNDLVVDASRQHRLVGFRCPKCGKTYAGGRGVCPIDSLELDEEHLVDLPPTRDDHELRDRHAGAISGADRDRAVCPGFRAARRHRSGAQLPAGGGAARPRRGSRCPGERGVGVRGGGDRGQPDTGV